MPILILINLIIYLFKLKIIINIKKNIIDLHIFVSRGPIIQIHHCYLFMFEIIIFFLMNFLFGF